MNYIVEFHQNVFLLLLMCFGIAIGFVCLFLGLVSMLSNMTDMNLYWDEKTRESAFNWVTFLLVFGMVLLFAGCMSYFYLSFQRDEFLEKTIHEKTGYAVLNPDKNKYICLDDNGVVKQVAEVTEFGNNFQIKIEDVTPIAN